MNQQLRVAIADDERDIRDYFQETLSLLGHEVVCAASSGNALVECCSDTQLDLIVTDSKMPDGDGIDAIDTLCQSEPIPVVLISGYYDREQIRSLEERHIITCLTKPVSQKGLEAAIATVRQRFHDFKEIRRDTDDAKQALQECAVIEQSKVALMRRDGIDVEEAQRRIQDAARQGSCKLVEAAQKLVGS